MNVRFLGIHRVIRTVPTQNSGKSSNPLLSWRPGKRAARQQVKVNVKNRLPGISSIVDDQTISSLIKPPRFGKISGDEEQVSDKPSVPFIHALYVRDMFIGHDQEVRRRLWIDVFECNDHLVAIYEL